MLEGRGSKSELYVLDKYTNIDSQDSIYICIHEYCVFMYITVLRFSWLELSHTVKLLGNLAVTTVGFDYEYH